MPKHKKHSYVPTLGLVLMLVGVLSLPVLVVRLFQLRDLFEAFESFGRIRSSGDTWLIWAIQAGMIVLFEIVLGNYLRTEKKVAKGILYASGVLGVYGVYRLVTDLYILVLLLS